MSKQKKINKSLGVVAATALILGGTSQIANASPKEVDLTNNVVVGSENSVGNSTNKVEENKAEEGKWINIKTLPKVKECEFGKGWGSVEKYRISFPGTSKEEFKGFQNYVDSINKTDNVTVNGVKCKNGDVSEKNNYRFGLLGLDINPSACNKDINTIIVKATGYNDMKIKIKKDGTFISEEEINGLKNEENVVKNEEKLKLPELEGVEYGKFYTDSEKYRISFKSKSDNEWNSLKKYRESVNATNEIIVNEVKYSKSNNVESKKNSFNFGLLGLEINPSAFKEGNNTINIKAKGYEDRKININKDKDKISINGSDNGNNNLKPKEENNSKPKEEKKLQWGEVKTLPKITTTQYGEIYGRVEYEIDFEKDSKYDEYIKAADPINDKTKLAEVTVNGVRYEENFNFNINQYHLGYIGGLELNDKSFTKDINIIIIKVDGFNDMRIKIKKDGTLVSQEELSSSTPIKENIKINIRTDINAVSGESINLKEDVLASVIGKNKIDLTDEVKIDAGDLDVNNPKEGIYEVKYSVTYNGQTETAKRKVIVKKGDSKASNLEDGIYTIGFKAYRYDIPENESMLGGFFDEKVKVEVKDGKIKLTMLNTLYASSLLDFCVQSNGEFISAKSTFKGNPDKYGDYKMQIYEFEISDLTSEHVGCVLVGMMGGSKNDIGDYSKYKKVVFKFNKNCIKGWDGFNADKEVATKEDTLNKALKEEGLDLDKDGIVTDYEISKAEGEIHLSGKNINDISRLENLGDKVTELYLNGNSIKELPKGVFDKLVNLEKLYLSSNMLTDLPEGIFDKLVNLKELNISQNNIRRLPKGIFDNLGKLESLGITKNKITELPNHIFDKLTFLKGLYMYDNNIENIPDGIGNLTKLETLALDKNNIEKIPEEIAKLTNLKKLTLNNNLINEIPSSIYDGLKNLSTFEIYDNNLREIPNNIKELLPNLNVFTVQLNKLDKKPSGVTKDFYPQKNVLNLQLKAKDKKIEWKQDISSLGLYVWDLCMNDCKSLSDYKEKLGGKTPEEFLRKKSRDWKIVTEIKKKDKDNKFKTIKTIITDNKNDELKGSYEDKDMKKGDEYRIIKSVFIGTKGEQHVLSNLESVKVPDVLIAEKPSSEKEPVVVNTGAEKPSSEKDPVIVNTEAEKSSNEKDPVVANAVAGDLEAKDLSDENTNGKGNSEEIKNNELPNTGLSLGGRLWATIGATLSGLGIVLMKKNK